MGCVCPIRAGLCLTDFPYCRINIAVFPLLHIFRLRRGRVEVLSVLHDRVVVELVDAPRLYADERRLDEDIRAAGALVIACSCTCTVPHKISSVAS